MVVVQGEDFVVSGWEEILQLFDGLIDQRFKTKSTHWFGGSAVATHYTFLEVNWKFTGNSASQLEFGRRMDWHGRPCIFHVTGSTLSKRLEAFF